jgi:hypothetical protein
METFIISLISGSQEYTSVLVIQFSSHIVLTQAYFAPQSDVVLSCLFVSIFLHIFKAVFIKFFNHNPTIRNTVYLLQSNKISQNSICSYYTIYNLAFYNPIMLLYNVLVLCFKF